MHWLGFLAPPAGDSAKPRCVMTSGRVTQMSVSQAADETVWRRWRTRCRQVWERRKRRRRRTGRGTGRLPKRRRARRKTEPRRRWGSTIKMAAVRARNATCQVRASLFITDPSLTALASCCWSDCLFVFLFTGKPVLGLIITAPLYVCLSVIVASLKHVTSCDVSQRSVCSFGRCSELVSGCN